MRVNAYYLLYYKLIVSSAAQAVVPFLILLFCVITTMDTLHRNVQRTSLMRRRGSADIKVNRKLSQFATFSLRDLFAFDQCKSILHCNFLAKNRFERLMTRIVPFDSSSREWRCSVLAVLLAAKFICLHALTVVLTLVEAIAGIEFGWSVVLLWICGRLNIRTGTLTLRASPTSAFCSMPLPISSCMHVLSSYSRAKAIRW